MYASIWFINEFGSTVRRDYEDEESLRNAITRLAGKRVSFHVIYCESEG